MRALTAVAIVDGANFLKDFAEAVNLRRTEEGRTDKITDSDVNALTIYQYLNELVKYQGGESVNLFRIYYFDCYPSGDMGDKYDRARQRLDSLSTRNKILMKYGNLSYGYSAFGTSKPNRISGKPEMDPSKVLDVKQKGVDVYIGVEIARIALKRIADRIIVFSGDTDLVPALMFARDEGIEVFSVKIGQKPVHQFIAQASDAVIEFKVGPDLIHSHPPGV